jgi:hypothetical protein
LRGRGCSWSARWRYGRGPGRRIDPHANEARCNLSRLLLLSGSLTEALTLGKTALAAHDKVMGQHHPLTKDSARITADALGRTEEAKALREQYGLTPPEKPQSS